MLFMILGKVMPYFLFCNSKTTISDEVFASAVEESLIMSLFILLTAKQKVKSLGQNTECLIVTLKDIICYLVILRPQLHGPKRSYSQRKDTLIQSLLLCGNNIPALLAVLK